MTAKLLTHAEREDERLQMLLAYAVIDTPEEAAFDELVQLAAHICDAPLAFINFIDKDRSWAKAAYGCPRGSHEREESFCSSVLNSQGFVEIHDLVQDPRFHKHAMVCGAPFLRWYAAVPLLAPFGQVLGTLCVLDHAPRSMSKDTRAALEVLGRQIVRLLESRRERVSLIKAQTELLIAKDEAQIRAQNKAEFIAKVSHEIRTPLNSVVGITNLLLDTELNPKQRDYIINTRRSAHHILRLLNNVLDLSRLNASKLEIERKPFALHAMMNELVEPLRILAQQKGLEMSIIQGPDQILEGDPLRMTQILMNLIHNAIKFTPKGAIQVHAEVVEERNGSCLLHFKVSDTGIGLNAEDCRRVFQAYQQVDSSHAMDGSGLGLSIAKQLVEAMNGQIGVQSQLGEGSCFWCMIPFKRYRAQPPAPVHKLSRSFEKVEPLQGRVLVVEDDILNAQVCLQYLQTFGLEAQHAESPERALELLRSGSFDLVLMDSRLDGSDGADLARQIKTNFSQTLPILAVTGSEETENLGMDDFLQKPFEREQLHRLLSSWLRNPSEKEIQQCQETLQRIEVQAHPGFVPQLLRGFLSRNPKELARMAEALASGDRQKLGLMAHSMKSTLGTFGILELVPTLRTLEIESESGSAAALGLHLQKLRQDMSGWYRQLETMAAPTDELARTA